MDFFPVSPGPFLPDITIDKKCKDDLSLNLDLENFPENIFDKQETDKFIEPTKEDGLFDHAQGSDFSMFDNLDSFLQEFGSSVSEPGLLSPSPPPSDSGLSNTSSDQMMSPDDNGDDDLSGTDMSEPEPEPERTPEPAPAPEPEPRSSFNPVDLIKIEPQSPDSTTERVATVCKSVGERTAVPAASRPVTTSAAPPTVTVLRQARPGQSILIPVNIKGSGNIKTVKILSAPNSLKSPTIVGELRPTQVRHGGTTRMVYSIAGGERLQTPAGPVITVCSNRQSGEGSSGGGLDQQRRKLDLSTEERRLLKKEGVLLPTHYPLTREEERELKRIRRKIRNKMSAQDSRKRKKEYIDGLEDRVRLCTAENQDLHKRIKRLESQNGQLAAQNSSLSTHNETLTSQLRRLQAHITRVALGAGRGAAHPSTCLMILLLSLSLCVMPSLKDEVKDEAALGKADTTRGARTLLQSSKADFLSAYLTRKPQLAGLAGFDLELSDAEDESTPAPVRRAVPSPEPPRKRARVEEPARWQDALREDPLDDGPPPEPGPAAGAQHNGTRPPAARVVLVKRQ